MESLLFVNPRSGDASPSTDELVQAARGRGVRVHVLREADDLAALARETDAEVLGIAGGDGSLAPVAEACIESGRAFVCLPFGTRNHFARDLGLDRDDPIGALGAFAEDAGERQVDAGRAGGRVFLNNVSLGLYADLVHDRERRRRRDEAFARLKALRRLATEAGDEVALTIDGAPVRSRLVLVANNGYELSAFSLGERRRLDAGRLCLYVMSGGPLPAWESRPAGRLVVDARGGSLRAAIDGEPFELELPLELRCEPQALRVRVPANRRE